MKLAKILNFFTLQTLALTILQPTTFAAGKGPETLSNRCKVSFICSQNEELQAPAPGKLEKLDMDVFGVMTQFLDPMSLDNLAQASHHFKNGVHEIRPLLNKLDYYKKITELQLTVDLKSDAEAILSYDEKQPINDLIEPLRLFAVTQSDFMLFRNGNPELFEKVKYHLKSTYIKIFKKVFPIAKHLNKRWRNNYKNRKSGLHLLMLLAKIPEISSHKGELIAKAAKHSSLLNQASVYTYLAFHTHNKDLLLNSLDLVLKLNKEEPTSSDHEYLRMKRRLLYGVAFNPQTDYDTMDELFKIIPESFGKDVYLDHLYHFKTLRNTPNAFNLVAGHMFQNGN